MPSNFKRSLPGKFDEDNACFGHNNNNNKKKKKKKKKKERNEKIKGEYSGENKRKMARQEDAWTIAT